MPTAVQRLNARTYLYRYIIFIMRKFPRVQIGPLGKTIQRQLVGHQTIGGATSCRHLILSRLFLFLSDEVNLRGVRSVNAQTACINGRQRCGSFGFDGYIRSFRLNAWFKARSSGPRKSWWCTVADRRKWCAIKPIEFPERIHRQSITKRALYWRMRLLLIDGAVITSCRKTRMLK